MRFVSAKKGGINTKVIKTEASPVNRQDEASLKRRHTYSPTVTQYHRRDEA